jgi:GTPase SAR1 family protein
MPMGNSVNNLLITLNQRLQEILVIKGRESLLDNVKIVVVGPSGVGKTTLRKVFFDQDNPLQLLTETLEPTYGVETSLYNLGGKIAVHDLAGQQIEEFLTTSASVFDGADLILAVLDSNDSWENNDALWQKIDEVRKDQCPDAYLSIFFHKVDLLTPEQRQSLDQTVQVLFAGKSNVAAYLTSIDKQFFFRTYQAFIASIRRSLFRVGDAVSRDFFVKLDIISQFAEKNTTTLEELISKLGADSDIVKKNLQEMEAKGYIILKDALRQVELSEIGQYVVQTTQNNLYLQIQEALSTDVDFIKGMILSDKIGRLLLLFETESNYIQNLPGNPASPLDPSFVAMFVSAIGNFGQTLNPLGFASIQLAGKNLQIIATSYGDITGIFFIANVVLDQTLGNIFRQFMGETYANFRVEIEDFLKAGNPESFNLKRDSLVQNLQQLNTVIQNVARFNQRITKDKLLSLYQKIQGEGLNESDMDNVKTLLFHYLITADPSLVEELFSYLDA